MTDTAEQCIICLEDLDGGPAEPPSIAAPSVHAQPEPTANARALLVAPPLAATTPNPATTTTEPVYVTRSADPQSDTTTPSSSDCDSPQEAHNTSNSLTHIAVLDGCGHQLHNECLQAWTAKANSCPICRQSFNIVNVFDRVGGTQISTYLVADKKQTVEWDPSAWLFEEEEEEPESEIDTRPCIVCDSSDHEEVLLLCDNCNAPYHTHCIGLDLVPRGEHWYCMECEQVVGENRPDRYDMVPANAPRSAHIRSHFFPRTRGTVRRARRHARGDPWRGAWGQFTESVYEALEIDLDYHDTDDDDLEVYRRSQQLREREHREYQRWQQRLNIATRAGAREVFQSSLPAPPHAVPPTLERPRETREEIQSWRALEMAKEEDTASSSRKRKTPSDSGAQSDQQPERKLKRPRTRRVPQQQNPAGPAASSVVSNPTTGLPAKAENGAAPRPSFEARHQPTPVSTGPTFLSSLLQEIKQHPTSDDENVRGVSINGRAYYVESSPASSPPPSAFSSPTTPTSPPPVDRPISPILPLSSHIEPKYPPANYRPTAGRQHSDSEVEPNRPSRKAGSKKPQVAHRSRSQDASSTRTIAIRHAPQDTTGQKRSDEGRFREGSPTLPFEMKESISRIVRGALRPHWASQQITPQQYETINRHVSRKLYNEAANPGRVLLNEEAKQVYERIATREVTRAVAELTA